ncbi:unnamed protein product [Prorocentrum cordatum]|uniref:Uncharacterized protein n=1 Tax=Prorocentrum cordatum TaxID=2364126 RepID=A0ABN9T9E1_9DINO|nr:unnamed protein product [Polarella glacialis]
MAVVVIKQDLRGAQSDNTSGHEDPPLLLQLRSSAGPVALTSERARGSLGQPCSTSSSACTRSALGRRPSGQAAKSPPAERWPCCQPVGARRDETVQRRKEELPKAAVTAFQHLEAALLPAPAATRAELPDEAAQLAWGAARRATKALNEAIDATEQARSWLAQEGLSFELGDAFDFEGFKAEFSKQVGPMFKPAAEELSRRREALSKLQEDFRRKTKKRRCEDEGTDGAGGPVAQEAGTAGADSASRAGALGAGGAAGACGAGPQRGAAGGAASISRERLNELGAAAKADRAAGQEQRLRRRGLRGALAPDSRKQDSLDLRHLGAGRSMSPRAATHASTPMGVKRGGALAASVYLGGDRLGENLGRGPAGPRARARGVGGPFVIGGGFNFGLGLFTDKARLWLEGICGQVASNSEGLGGCHFAEDAPPSGLDFFIVSQDLARSWGPELIDAEVQALCEGANCQNDLDRAFLGIMGHVEDELLSIYYIDPADAGKMARPLQALALWLRRGAEGPLPDATRRGLPAAWKGAPQDGPSASPEARAAWADALTAGATALADTFRVGQAKGFSEWVPRSMKAGGGAVHAYNRGPQGGLPDEIVEGAPVGGRSTRPPLERPSLERAGRAAKQFAGRTGAGADLFNPRLIAGLSNLCVESLDLCMACERLGARRQEGALAPTASALSIYKGPRGIVLAGIVSEAFHRATGSVAGRGRAGRLPRCCVAVVDAEHRGMCMLAPLAIAFDDCSLRATGTEAEVGILLDQTAGAVAGSFERILGAVVSRGKSEILGGSDGLRRIIEPSVAVGAFLRAKAARNLGVDYAMGGKAVTVASSSTFTSSSQADRALRVRRSSKAAGAQLIYSGLKPVATYGISCMAWSTKAPLRWRSQGLAASLQRPVDPGAIDKRALGREASPPLASSGRCPVGCEARGALGHLAWDCPALGGMRRQWEVDDPNLDRFLSSGGPRDADSVRAQWSRRLVKEGYCWFRVEDGIDPPALAAVRCAVPDCKQRYLLLPLHDSVHEAETMLRAAAEASPCWCIAYRACRAARRLFARTSWSTRALGWTAPWRRCAASTPAAWSPSTG